MRLGAAALAFAIALSGQAVLAAEAGAAQTVAEAALPNAERVTLEPAVLREIVRSMDVEVATNRSLLDGFWQWLHERLAEQGINLNWLEAFRRVFGGTAEWVSRLSIAAMIGIAAWVVINELRHRRGGGARRRRSQGAVAAPAAAGLDWASLAALPPAERPGAALQLALAALADEGRHFAAAATHRDVFADARHTLPAPWRRPLARLAVLAERVRYGTWRPSAEQGDAAVALGRAVAQAARQQ